MMRRREGKGRHGKKLVVSLPPLCGGHVLLSLAPARPATAGVGEATRGCRLDADNAGGVSFVQSSMTLLSWSSFRFVASPRDSPVARKRDAARALHPPR